MIWKYGDQIGWGPFVQGDQIFWDRLSRGTKVVGDHLSMGTKFLGTICPWGQEVGDQKSGDQMGSGLNESQPLFGLYAACLQGTVNQPKKRLLTQLCDIHKLE